MAEDDEKKREQKVIGLAARLIDGVTTGINPYPIFIVKNLPQYVLKDFPTLSEDGVFQFFDKLVRFKVFLQTSEMKNFYNKYAPGASSPRSVLKYEPANEIHDLYQKMIRSGKPNSKEELVKYLLSQDPHLLDSLK